MKNIKLFEEYVSRGNEGIVCYHLMMKHDRNKDKEAARNILKNGFTIPMVSGGLMGPCIYSYVYLDQLLKGYWIPHQNLPIIKFRISNPENFIIADEDIAKHVFGKFDIKDQLKQIAGNEWLRDNEKSIDDILLNVHNDFFGFNMFHFFNIVNMMGKNSLKTMIKGYIGMTREDSIWACLYDESLAIPLAVSFDGGNSWEE